MKFYLLALLFAIAQAEQPFRVKDGKNNTCLLLQLDGSLNLAATPLNSSDTAPQPVSLPFKSASVKATSNCTLIRLNMTKSAEVWFQFTEDSGNWKVTPISAFIPSEVFGSEDNETGLVTFQADALEVFEKNNSFLCKSSQDYQFKQQGNTSTKFNYTVMATTTNFQIQSLADEDFTNATTECQADKKSTTTPTPTTPTSTHAPSSTTPAPEPVLNVTCTDKNVTRIRLTGSFELAITYNATDPKTKKTAVKTVYIPVPGSVNTNNSKCEANASAETLSLDFFDGWNINFVIVSDSSSALLAAGSGDYHVANITVTYKFDNHLPNANETGQKDAVYKDGGKNYLKASSSGYYTCKANTSISMGPDQVKLTMKDLKYKAFNDKGDAEFSGDVSECSADDDTSSVVPIAVGAALAGLVVIVLIAYLIGRKRSRKSGYESV